MFVRFQIMVAWHFLPNLIMRRYVEKSFIGLGVASVKYCILSDTLCSVSIFCNQFTIQTDVIYQCPFLFALPNQQVALNQFVLQENSEHQDWQNTNRKRMLLVA